MLLPQEPIANGLAAIHRALANSDDHWPSAQALPSFKRARMLPELGCRLGAAQIVVEHARSMGGGLCLGHIATSISGAHEFHVLQDGLKMGRSENVGPVACHQARGPLAIFTARPSRFSSSALLAD
jgi:hypothetical protein